jgi:acyl carrier protein
MCGFLAIAVSVKIGTTVRLKRDSLFSNAGRIIDALLMTDPRTAVQRWCWQENGKLKMNAVDFDVRNRVLALVKTILRQNAIAAEVDAESLLIDVGLTSMDMVNLMLGVEAEFDFTIPQNEITPENFQSVTSLERMIAAQLQAEQAA